MKESIEIEKKLKKVFEAHKEVGIVYFFGSRVKGETGPLSDYDFGVYTPIKDNKKIYELKLELMGELSRILKIDAIDVVMINDAKSSELKYHIVQEGKIIFEREPFRVQIEPKILNEYFDFKESLIRNNLTKVK